MIKNKKTVRNDFKRPDLVVPYQEKSIRDKLYPYLLYGAIIIATVVAIVMISVKGAS